MPDTRKHRGPHPDDARLFSAPAIPSLQSAVGDLSWLLSHGYAQPSALKLVGDRHRLDARQRMAVARAACTDEQLGQRRRKQLPAAAAMVNQPLLLIDGYNVLTTIETALGGGVIFRCRDGCVRDISSVHGTWRKVAETIPALEHIGEALHAMSIARIRWLLDRPVSNSARLAAVMRGIAEQHDWFWEISLDASPDAVLIASPDVIATADSAVLDRTVGRWFDLASHVLENLMEGSILARDRLLPLHATTA
jgi:hypothetical protein